MTEQQKPEIFKAGSGKFPREGGSGNATVHCYSVEARNDYIEPVIIGGQGFDREWRQVGFVPGSPGVPTKLHSPQAEAHGYLSWTAAQALRWWFMAQCNVGGFGPASCMQTRLVEREFRESWSETILGYHDVIGGGGSDERTRIAHYPAGKAATEPMPLHREPQS